MKDQLFTPVTHNPLAQVYLDLSAGKTKTHFDQVLNLQGKAQSAFGLVTVGKKSGKTENSLKSGPRYQRSSPF